MPEKSPISRREFLKSSAVAAGGVVSLDQASRAAPPAGNDASSAGPPSDAYYPSPESKDGWRRCRNKEEVRELASMDPKQLNVIGHVQHVIFQGPWAIVVIRNGYLVWETYGVPAFPSSTFDIWSCTKSLTATAFGLLFNDSRNHKLPNNVQINLESRAYDFIPAGHPLSDPRKEKILLRHLLTMTSGIPGQNTGIIGLSVKPGQGELEFVLGRQRDKFGFSAGTMVADPGKVWDYSDPAYTHLSLIFAQVTGREIDEVLDQRIFRRIGVRNYVWNRIGGAGNLGPHTNAISDMHISARDLARFGYLVLRRGQWEGEQLIPQWWTDLATRTSQKLNPSYGLGWWVNTEGTQWPSVPKDAFALMGYASSRCYIVPSLDLVVAHVGFRPPQWPADSLLPPVVDSIIGSGKG